MYQLPSAAPATAGSTVIAIVNAAATAASTGVPILFMSYLPTKLA